MTKHPHYDRPILRSLARAEIGGRRPVIGPSAKLAVAIGLALLTVAISAAFAVAGAPAVKHPTVHPAVGGLTTIVQVHFVADGLDTDSSDEVDVTAPSGTPCANETGGLVAMDNIQGPHEDGSGPVTLYIGPGAAERYPAMEGYNAYDLWGSAKRLTRWCPGTYAGEITYQNPGPPVLTTAFRFRISATKHVKPPPKPVVAHHLKPVMVSPSQGRRGTAFAVRYRADAAPFDSGDAIEVDGPDHSACKGGLVRVLAERPDAHAGPVTAHIGPGADKPFRWGNQATTTASPAPDNGTGKPLRRWCPGTYDGTIFYEHGPKFTVIARFALHVAP